MIEDEKRDVIIKLPQKKEEEFRGGWISRVCTEFFIYSYIVLFAVNSSSSQHENGKGDDVTDDAPTGTSL